MGKLLSFLLQFSLLGKTWNITPNSGEADFNNMHIEDF